MSGRSTEAAAVRAQVEAFRRGLQAQAEQVLAAQDRARDLLAQAELLVAQAQAQAAQVQAHAATEVGAVRRDQERAPAELAASRAALDAVSANVTTTLAPVVTERGRRAGTSQAEVLTVLRSAGNGYPSGFAPTGQVLHGTASWYGPGFVGSPTASGAPYDPEQPTCANKELPLGTVLHVVANGHSVNCLVNDRGPYIGDRVLDLALGSRALGYDGTASVVVEVLGAA